MAYKRPPKIMRSKIEILDFQEYKSGLDLHVNHQKFMNDPRYKWDVIKMQYVLNRPSNNFQSVEYYCDIIICDSKKELNDFEGSDLSYVNRKISEYKLSNHPERKMIEQKLRSYFYKLLEENYTKLSKCKVKYIEEKKFELKENIINNPENESIEEIKENSPELEESIIVTGHELNPYNHESVMKDELSDNVKKQNIWNMIVKRVKSIYGISIIVKVPILLLILSRWAMAYKRPK